MAIAFGKRSKCVTELLAADHLKPANRIRSWRKNSRRSMSWSDGGRDAALIASRFKLDILSNPPPPARPRAGRRTLDSSSPVFIVDHSACILCDRCVRACDDVMENHVIGRTGKGATAGIGFDLNDPMGESTCVQCGECMVSCPTSAITFKPVAQVKILARRPIGQSSLRARELTSDPVFAGIPPKFLALAARPGHSAQTSRRTDSLPPGRSGQHRFHYSPGSTDA